MSVSVEREDVKHKACMIRDLLNGGYQQQILHSKAVSFAEKQHMYAASYERFLPSLNGSCVMDCKGII